MNIQVRTALDQSRDPDVRDAGAPDKEPQAAPSVALSAAAAKRVAAILTAEAPGAALRIGVDGGGCSGFQYTFDIVGAAEPDDLVLRSDGATVLIDPVSLDYLRGSTVDFVNDLMGQAFKIHNPQATASCGCGTSFAI